MRRGGDDASLRDRSGVESALFTTLDVDPAKLDQHEQKFVAGIFKSCHPALLRV
jgi:hypothetical protein